MNSTEVDLEAGEGVKILARCDETGSTEWCKVETADGRRGYVATANLDVIPDVASEPAAATGLLPLDRSPNHWSQVGWQRPSTPVFEPAIRDRVRHFSNMFMCLPSRGHDEVVPGIIIAEAEAALDLELIQRLGVTHLVNTCEMRDEDRGTFREGFCVDTGPEYYGDDVTYHGFHAMDASDYDLSVHFGAANKFIGYCVEYCEAPAAAAAADVSATVAATMHSCRSKPGFGKVMVHCKAGASRSAAIVIAFLLSIGWDLDYAIDTILDSREIAPNNGFVGLLAQYEADCQTSSSA